MSKNEQQNQPLLNTIGLCFSGGGYRAAAFSMGVLSYLNRLKYHNAPLLDRIKAISTVSGGTITGAYYAYTNYQKIPFDTFYSTLYSFLKEDSLLSEAMNILHDADLWKKRNKKKSLINAFAVAYDRLLKTGTFENLDISKSNSLEDVCLNATEFTFGLTFRFQNGGVFGNNPLKSKYLNQLLSKIKIADAIASSSCFPFGFEPMIFPDDYFDDHSDPDFRNLKEKEYFNSGIGIMDGGIVDNQGIGSMINIDKRKKEGIGTFLICDVGSYKMDPWLQEESSDTDKKKKKRSRSINQLFSKVLSFLKFKWYHWVVPILGILISGINSMELILGQQWPFLYLLGGGFIGLGLLLLMIGIISNVVRAGLILSTKRFYNKNVPDELIDDIASLKILSISTVKRMIIERLTSAKVMVSEVFLNQIRRLNYRLLFEKQEYQKKSISLRVYQLIGKEETLGEKFRPNPKIKMPSEILNKSAQIASETPTTLWWSGEDERVNRLENLIACGQFTACYNILDYLIKNEDKFIDDESKNLKEQLEKDWSTFNKEPLFLL